jgi:acetolactate decarboxylase
VGAGAEVRWAGAQRALFAGDLRARASLDGLAELPHLYAVGPAAGLRGEITVLDGRTYVSRVEGGRVVVDRSVVQEAPLLVWAQVARWEETDLSPLVEDIRDLEHVLLDRARALGIDASPFAFDVTGVPDAVQLHVLDKRDDRRHTRALHEQCKVRFTIERAPVEIVGFHSTAHAGVFIPDGERVHMHVCTTDGRMAGHVEHIRFTPGMRLRLPASTRSGGESVRAAGLARAPASPTTSADLAFMSHGPASCVSRCRRGRDAAARTRVVV